MSSYKEHPSIYRHEFIASVENKKNTDQLVNFILDYYSKRLENHEVTAPKIVWGEKGPQYRKWDHTTFLRDIKFGSNPDILAIVEETIHSVVMGMPKREVADAEQTREQRGVDQIPLNEPTLRKRKFIEKLRNTTRHYNTEEFLARYASYQFLSDPVCKEKISKLFHISEKGISEVLRKAVEIGLLLEPNYETGFSDAWYHAWGYLFASVLFVKEDDRFAETFFDSTNTDIESMAINTLYDLRLSSAQLEKYTESRSYGIERRFRKFMKYQDWIVNPEMPEALQISDNPRTFLSK